MPKTTIQWCKDPKDLYRLTVFVQNDIDPQGYIADAAELLGHVKSFQDPILNAGADLHHKKSVPLFLCKPAPGYPYIGEPGTPNYYSFEEWKEWLVAHGVREKDISPIVSPLPKSLEEKFPISNTATETCLFVQKAKEMKWRSVYVVTHPIHILRAFTCAVSFTIRHYPELRVYAKAGYPAQPWTQATIANQGIVTGTRLDGAMDAEYERLNTHWGNEYDHVMAEEVLEYVRNRDPIVCSHPNCPSPYDTHSHCPKCGEAVYGVGSSDIPCGGIRHVCGAPDQIVP